MPKSARVTPDATREFCANLFGWSYSDGAYPGYTFVAAGAEGGTAGGDQPAAGRR